MRQRAWYGTRVSVLAVGLGAASLLLVLVMLFQFAGPFSVLRPGGGAQPRAAVLWLPAAADASEPSTRQRLAAWRRPLGERGLARRQVSLETLEPAERFVVVIPDARRLAAEEAAALTRFVERGGGALLAGSVGVRSAAGEWQGYALMRRLLGVPRVASLAPERTGALAPGARGPLAAPLPPATRLELRQEAGAPALPDPGAELVWQAAEPAARGASRRLELGRGRLAWLAAGPENADVGSRESRIAFAELLRSALAWSSRDPVTEILPRSAFHADALGEAEREDWRRLAADVVASSRPIGAQRLLVEVTNRRRETVESAVLRVYLGRPLSGARVAPTLLRQSLPELRSAAEADRLELLLPPVTPGSHAWHLDAARAG